MLNKAIISLLSLSILSATDSFSGTTGNLTGKISDVKTKETLPLVNILVVGSGRGTVSNEKGEYSLTGITPGIYTIRYSLLGYRNIEIKKVEIQADETSVYDVKMASEDIEMEGITVEGQPPLVDTKKVAGDQTFNKDKIESIPNVKGVEDVLRLQAGVVQFGGQLFLRGGRANETQILVDGVVVNDVSGAAAANQELQQLYAGTSTSGGGGALGVSANAIQSVSVASSGLDAEYGNAQSGVVNITTKSGGDSYSGSMQYRTDGITSNGFNERYYAGNIGGPEPITAFLLPSLGINVPGKLSFFLSANFEQSDGAYAFNTNQFYNPVQRRIKLTGILGFLGNAGLLYSDKQINDFSFNTKLNYSIGEADQFTYSYRANGGTTHQLASSFTNRDRYDSTTSVENIQGQNVLQWTHIFGTNTLLKGYVSRIESHRTSSLDGLTPAQYSTFYGDINGDGFRDFGTSQSWSDSRNVIWNTKFDYSSQIHPIHFLKAGMEYYYEDISSTSISFPNDPDRKIDSIPRGEFPEYGFARWVSGNFPSRGSFYLQDNIEFTGLNIRVGLRYDYLYLGKQVFDPGFVERWEAVSRLEADWLDNKSFFSQFTSGRFSPRLAIGYPVSERTVFYFNYGHFLQYPDRDQYFHDPISTTLDGNYIGNPGLKPQKTIQYEAGFDQLLTDDLSLGIRGYYKDIFDYASFRRLPVSPTVDVYVNLDYASTRGFEVILTKGGGENLSGSVGYTFQLAKGRSSHPKAAQDSPELFGLPREVRLDFDQTHTLNFFLSYRIKPNDDFPVFGLNIDNWGASVAWTFGSGFPYTPFTTNTSQAAQYLNNLYLKNSADGPSTSEVNISFFKGFRIVDKLNLVLTLDVTNLLNRRNVDLNGGGFNSLEGRVIRYGDYAPDDFTIYPWQAGGGSAFDRRVPPFAFRPPRQIAFGVKVNWD
ncbi:MAG TPA: TonB-dependent receptor [Bacteroidota bacterium]